MKYNKDKSTNEEQPTHNRLKGEEAAKQDMTQDERDRQPEGGKYKGVKHDNASGTHAEGQYDKRDDDATMHPSSDDE